MNTYSISPKLVRIAVDGALNNQFSDLDSRLAWRPLTTNLESCEDPPYLYFCINLVQHRNSPTFAGFSSGAPFMLTRERDLKKRAFFLRHWVRRDSIEAHKDVAHVQLQHMAVAVRDRRLLVRVDIDRPFNTADAFRSAPFATFMFQIAHVDAFIEGLPGVRFAFAIERTITSEEREVVASMGRSVPSKGMKTKPIPTSQLPSRPNPFIPHPTTTIPRPARPIVTHPKMLQVPQTISAPPMQQSVVPQRTPSYPPAAARPTQVVYQNPYQFTSSRPNHAHIAQKPSPRALHIAPQITKPAPRTQNRPIHTHIPIPVPPSPPPQVDTSNKIVHPYMKLWEDHDPDDPYQPIFITKDERFDTKARRSFIFEDTPPYASRVDHRNLFGVPSKDYPLYYFDGPDISVGGGDPDLEVSVKRLQKPVGEHSEETSSSLDDVIKRDASSESGYASAVVAASEYNKSLRDERIHLRRWLVEDLAAEEESEEEEEEDDGDQDSSE
ncbi:hypothetical protein BWQ96_01649 [Gracilariopsis chorda]|uniref:Uncharacterized protein n=1 Tax=Gracilariopsis chorda TaxID=448386 RepID=A0A2V3J529_9FLOR|nr:hypothetical protein BWQ96_01649 [Gracilariopsis chorda]|eukprot:PXF48480.1 hypothetical protein BWQ96_01649 [Gracilariopsis chorda]